MFPLNPVRKIFSTLYQNSDYDYRLLSYGSPAALLDKCNYYINYRGARLQSFFSPLASHKLFFRMNEDFRESLEKTVIIPFSNHALKSVVLAYRDVNTNIQVQDFATWSEELLENNLTFISLIGIKDPLRDDVPEAVALCLTSFSVVFIHSCRQQFRHNRPHGDQRFSGNGDFYCKGLRDFGEVL